jgi:hypothetical protein
MSPDQSIPTSPSPQLTPPKLEEAPIGNERNRNNASSSFPGIPRLINKSVAHDSLARAWPVYGVSWPRAQGIVLDSVHLAFLP